MRNILYLIKEDEEGIGREFVVRVVQNIGAQLVKMLNKQREWTAVDGSSDVYNEIFSRFGHSIINLKQIESYVLVFFL